MASEPLTPYQRRLIRYERLVRDVIATLGGSAGTHWLGVHRALAKTNLAALEREWRYERHCIITQREEEDS